MEPQQSSRQCWMTLESRRTLKNKMIRMKSIPSKRMKADNNNRLNSYDRDCSDRMCPGRKHPDKGCFYGMQHHSSCSSKSCTNKTCRYSKHLVINSKNCRNKSDWLLRLYPGLYPRSIGPDPNGLVHSYKIPRHGRSFLGSLQNRATRIGACISQAILGKAIIHICMPPNVPDQILNYPEQDIQRC